MVITFVSTADPPAIGRWAKAHDEQTQTLRLCCRCSRVGQLVGGVAGNSRHRTNDRRARERRFAGRDATAPTAVDFQLAALAASRFSGVGDGLAAVRRLRGLRREMTTRVRLRDNPTTVTLLWMIGVVTLAGSAAVAITLGPAGLSVGEVASIVVGHLGGTAANVTPIRDGIVWDLRLPRTLLAALCGAGLGLCGAIMQSLLRNPLADPFVLGISSGASTGAVLIVILGVGSGVIGLSSGAFIGAVDLLRPCAAARPCGRRHAGPGDPGRCRRDPNCSPRSPRSSSSPRPIPSRPAA